MSQDRDPSSGLDATVSAPGSTPRTSSAPGDPAVPLAPGATLGRYVLIEAVGAGGMGMVFRARDPDLGRDVAVKVLHSADARADGLERRLLREAQAMATVSHDNLANVYDIGTSAGRVFIAMELVNGTTLRVLIGDQAKTWRDKLAAVMAAGRGLAAAHSAGVIHRDFKPDNVLIAAKTGRVKVVDFGLARADRTAADVVDTAHGPGMPVDLSAHLTQTGALLGTPAYMAPEQHAGEPVDARSDQFAFAVTAWEAVFGVRPFPTDTYSALVAAVRAHAVKPPPKVAGVPPALEAALRRALSPAPTDRFPTMDAALAALEQAVVPRRKFPWLLAGAGAAVIAGGITIAAIASRAPAGEDEPLVDPGLAPGPSPASSRAAIAIGLDPDLDPDELPDDGPDQGAIASVITAHRGELARCLEQAKITGSGTVTIEAMIAGSGRVTSATVARTDVPDSSLGSCVASAVLLWQFPRSPGADDVELELPIVFGAERGVDRDRVRAERDRDGFSPENLAELERFRNFDLGNMMKDLTRIQADHFLLPRSMAVAALEANAEDAAARFSPNETAGARDGLKVHAIEPGSLVERLGVANGDVILSVNGIELTTDENIERARAKVKNGSHIDVRLRRGDDVRSLRVELLPDDLVLPDLSNVPGLGGRVPRPDVDGPKVPPVPPAPPAAPPPGE